MEWQLIQVEPWAGCRRKFEPEAVPGAVSVVLAKAVRRAHLAAEPSWKAPLSVAKRMVAAMNTLTNLNIPI